ncbi:MAG: guanylate kinase [Candidatus Omnitrophica bacterium]|nr:guanylate kinase [Candidatus Omnitrophota bacterium]
MSNRMPALPKAKIVIISGPSGCGKTTLHKALLASPALKGKLVKTISATTRQKRPGERHGREYLFLSPQSFEEKIKKGYFLEWQKVFDHYYGTPKKRAQALINKGTNVLLCIDVKGAKAVAGEFPGRALRIFIKPPSMKVLAHRLKARGSESRETLKKRLNVARREMREAVNYDHVIVNGDLKKALGQLKKIVCSEVLGVSGSGGRSLSRGTAT